MNCLIVEDEPLAQEVLEEFIRTVPYLSLVGKCSSAFEALDKIRNNKVDLIFLDIRMPHVTGIDFINSLEHKPMFIFTTAFSEYALEGFNLNAVDYLVKPIPFDRFLRAANKAYELYNLRLGLGEKPAEKTEERTEQFILVKADYQTQRIELSQVKYIEGLKDYIKIYLTTGKPVVTLNSLRNMAEKLPPEEFVRVHKSYIVSIRKIDSISRNRIVMGDKWIPIGDNFKDDFYALLNRNNIALD
jgi:DNA-binding LytR/AlgR family response regulator